MIGDSQPTILQRRHRHHVFLIAQSSAAYGQSSPLPPSSKAKQETPRTGILDVLLKWKVQNEKIRLEGSNQKAPNGKLPNSKLPNSKLPNSKLPINEFFTIPQISWPRVN